MASAAIVCFMFAFATTCFARSIPAGNDERILVTVDYGGPHTHPPTPHHDDYSKLFPDYHDPHTHPPSGPPHDESLNLSGIDERILATVDYEGPHTHPPTPHHDNHSKLFPNYHDPYTSPPSRSSHDEPLNLSENSNRLQVEIDYHPIDPTPQPPEIPEPPPKKYQA